VASPKAVIVVDDDADIVFIVKKSLERAGYLALGFTDPAQALEHIESNIEQCGLIISDVRMPKINGLEFAARVRQSSPSINVILMSAYSMRDVEVPPELKVVSLLQKPVTPSQIKQVPSKYFPLVPQAGDLR
jgi:two-component system C4-dicarboxylate transport response regulator DctD